MATITATVGGGNWSSSGTWDAGVPTAADDVVLGASSGNVTIDTGAVCRSLNASAYVGTLTHNASTALIIGDATAGAGNVALAFNTTANMTYTLGHTTSSSITFLSSSATQQTINFNSHITGSVTFGSSSVSGNYQLTGQWGSNSLSDNPYVNLPKGTLDTNGQTCYWGRFDTNFSNYARTLTLGSSVINVRNHFYARYYNDNFTLNANTSTINMYGSGIEFWGGGETFNVVNFTGSSSSNVISSGFTTATLSVTGTASKTDAIQFGADVTVTSSLVLAGNSAANRLVVKSNTLGTARTITNTGATMTWSNVDFRDITLSDSYDASAITGGSGNCGGNTNITFTTADDWYWKGSGSRNFSDYTYWYTASNGGGSQMASTRTVLPQDSVYIDADSIDASTTITQDLARIPALDTSWCDAFTFSLSSSQEAYGSYIISANVTYDGNQTTNFFGRGSHVLTQNSTNNSLGTIGIYSIGGTITLGSNIQLTPYNRDFNLINGTLALNGYNLYARVFGSSNSNARTLNMGSGTIKVGTVNGLGYTWSTETSTNLTLTPSTSTIEITGTNVNALKFGSLTFNNITFLAGAGTDSIQGSNTFNVFTITAPRTVKFTAGTTTTVGSFVAVGDASNAITITSATAATHTLSDTSGENSVEYCTISYSTAQGGADWLSSVSDGNVDGGNNTGWDFSSDTTFNAMFFGCNF